MDYLEINTDITAKKESEKALQKAHDGLEQRVLERTHELQTAHRRLIELARESGMAEVATSVLHNVGNVLNSINTSIAVLKNLHTRSAISMLSPVSALLAQHTADLSEFLTQDTRGRQVPEFIAALSEDSAAERKVASEELRLLEQNIEYVKTIITLQQRYTGALGLSEQVMLSDLIEDALQINAVSHESRGIEIVRDYQQQISGVFEKYRVLQILVNLISNAKFALISSPRPDKRLTLRMRDADGYAIIEVADNGIGIPDEIRNRIFQFGFTSRPGGHGFGLHSSAIAAQDMGGRLSFQSDGEGQGATFKLELRYVQASKPV